MALQIWLPLDGSLENKGCCGDDFIIKTNPYYIDNGKIGKALYSGSITMSSATSKKILNNKSFSFCCWVYVNAETGDTTKRNLLFGNDASKEDYNNRKFSIFQYPNCNGLHLSWMNDEKSVFFYSPVIENFFPSYEWTHVAVTYENPTVRIYKNGVLVKEDTNKVSNSSSFEYETYLFSHVPSQGRYLNDYRVYDTCLSAAEVKEIAQGLVLHYKLSPYLNWLDYTQQKSITRGSGNNFTDYTYNSALKNCTDTQYIVDFDAKGTADDMNIDIYFRDSSGAAYAATAQQIITTDWKHYTLTINGSPENLVLFRVRLWSGTVGDVVYFKNMQLTSANMPLENEIIIDSSGYGHHGTIKNTVLSTEDTPKYSRAINLPNADSAINCGRGGMVTDSMTVNMWINYSTWGRPASCTDGGGWNFEVSGGLKLDVVGEIGIGCWLARFYGGISGTLVEAKVGITFNIHLNKNQLDLHITLTVYTLKFRVYVETEVKLVFYTIKKVFFEKEFGIKEPVLEAYYYIIFNWYGEKLASDKGFK